MKIDQKRKQFLENNVYETIFKREAEKKGFEPLVPEGTTVFKTAAIDHSAISP